MEDSRETPIRTKKGIIFYSNDCKDWKIDYPDGTKRYGGATSEKVAIFFLSLSMGHSLEMADQIAFEETKLIEKK